MVLKRLTQSKMLGPFLTARKGCDARRSAGRADSPHADVAGIVSTPGELAAIDFRPRKASAKLGRQAEMHCSSRYDRVFRPKGGTSQPLCRGQSQETRQERYAAKSKNQTMVAAKGLTKGMDLPSFSAMPVIGRGAC